jgi:hypothetical protein
MTTVLLSAGLLMEETSASLVPPPRPSFSLLVERVQLLDDTARQLQVLAVAARAALAQERR